MDQNMRKNCKNCNIQLDRYYNVKKIIINKYFVLEDKSKKMEDDSSE